MIRETGVAGVFVAVAVGATVGFIAYGMLTKRPAWMQEEKKP